MTTYVAFLRGINVGGHNRMAMDDLQATCESLGLSDVRTYIQSGNVVFESDEADPGALADDLHDAIEDAFGYDVTVMVRTREDLDAVVEGQPFDEPTDADTKLYVTFLDEVPDEERVEALLAAGGKAESFVVNGREVYSELRKDLLGDGRFTDAGRTLGVPATRRNWDVVTKVQVLAST
jgi:uncharacterized protein (DUF1697 family)